MDVVRLGERYSTLYLPDELIEGYSSMIWTERFQDPGDFELKTPYVRETLALLPEDTLISHTDTRDVMMVENLVIATDADGNDELTVTGRSLDFFAEHRWVKGPYQKKRQMIREYRPVSALAVLLYQAFCNDSGLDLTREGQFKWNYKDRVGNVCITDSVHHRRALHRRWLEEGPLEPQIMKFMLLANLGIRVIRPWHAEGTTHDLESVWNPWTNSAKVIEVTAHPRSDRGKIHRTWVEDITALRFDIHDGRNRSDDQSINPRISFNYLRGDIDNAGYLFSDKEFKTVIEIQPSLDDLEPDEEEGGD